MLDYYTNISADNKEQAIDLSEGDHIQWFPLDSDDPIEAIDVELIEDNFEDKVIDMSNGLIN